MIAVKSYNIAFPFDQSPAYSKIVPTGYMTKPFAKNESSEVFDII